MMALSTKGRYAARIMVWLAARPPHSPPATKHEIARGESISPDYVEQIMIRLKAANLVCSHRGRNGGFTPAREPDSITLRDVLLAVEGPVAPAPCLSHPCARAPRCPTHPIWSKTKEMIDSLFAQTSIGQMARDAEGASALPSQTYQI